MTTAYSEERRKASFTDESLWIGHGSDRAYRLFYRSFYWWRAPPMAP